MDECLPEHAALISDFTAWQLQNPNKICCNGQSVTEDGRLVLNLSINDANFRLFCPANYPNHEDIFFVETDRTDFWCIALNEFIIDYPDKITIDVILAKAFLYCKPSSIKSYNSSDDESENESDYYQYNNDDFDLNENDRWEVIISEKKRAWREKEGELRLRYNRPKISDMFDGISMDYPRQIFSSSAASAILINDLINVMGSKKSNGIIVDPIENNICKWSVLLKNFHPESRMSKDLEEVKELYGYDHVELQLHFTMDLYPSHPPLLQLIRPKLIGVFDRKNFVKLVNWNPARDMASVLQEIKDYVNKNGAIDIHSEQNGIKINSLKKILTKLADGLKGESEHILNSDFSHSQSVIHKMSQSSYPEKCLKGNQHFPPKSSSECNSLNTEEKNILIVTILTEFLYYLQNIPVNSLPECIVPDNRMTHSFFIFNLASNNNVSDGKNFQVTSKDLSYSSLISEAVNRLMEREKLNITLKECKVHNRLCERKNFNIITNPSFGLDSQSQNIIRFKIKKIPMNNHRKCLYNVNTIHKFNKFSRSKKRTSKLDRKHMNGSTVSSFNTSDKVSKVELNDELSYVLKTIKESMLIPFIRSKLSMDAFFEIWLTISVYSKVIEVLIELASNSNLIELLAPTNMQTQSIADLLRIQEENVAMILTILTDITGGHPTEQADLEKVKLAKTIIATSELIRSKLANYKSTNCSNKESSISNNQFLNSNSNHCQVKSLNSTYEDSLKDFQFRKCDIDLETHFFKNEYISDISSSRNYFRMAQEFAILSKSLPLKQNSAIFVTMDNSKSFLMRALITGAEGTCYNGGCFNFDIYLSKDYPNSQLKINCTTFPDGYLSSLSFEGNSLNNDIKMSTKLPTILQVLKFIQNEILSFKVSGENMKKGNSEESRNAKYTLMTNVIKFAMIDQIRKPIPEFEEVIKTHFRLQKDRILSELNQYDCFKNSKILHTLKEELDRLTYSQKT